MKKPSKQQIAALQPIIDLCTSQIIKSPSSVSSADRVCIEITWKRVGKVVELRPARFPKGLALGSTATSMRVRYDCEKLLRWFKDNRYTKYDASDLYKQRHGMMISLSYVERRLEKFLEIDVDLDQEDVYND